MAGDSIQTRSWHGVAVWEDALTSMASEDALVAMFVDQYKANSNTTASAKLYRLATMILRCEQKGYDKILAERDALKV